MLKHARNRTLAVDQRPRVARAFLDLLEDPSSPEIRLQATLALSGFTGVQGVVAALRALVTNPQESIELRYAAFRAFNRTGPTPEYLHLLQQLESDEIFGATARSALDAWEHRTDGGSTSTKTGLSHWDFLLRGSDGSRSERNSPGVSGRKLGQGDLGTSSSGVLVPAPPFVGPDSTLRGLTTIWNPLDVECRSAYCWMAYRS